MVAKQNENTKSTAAKFDRESRFEGELVATNLVDFRTDSRTTAAS
jgi:hypothetical protein